MNESSKKERDDAAVDLIFARRSIRVYMPGDISDPQVRKLLEAAMAAPSAMTKDPWRFVVVRNAESLARLAEACPGGKMLPTGALAIVVCGDQETAFEQNVGYLVQDCSAAIENLLLCAHGLGLGACWVGAYPSETSCKKLKQLLRLPPSFVPVAVIALGLPGEELPPRTRYNQEYVRQETWEP